MCAQIFLFILVPFSLIFHLSLDSPGYDWERFSSRCRVCAGEKGHVPLKPHTSINTIVVNLLKTWVDLGLGFFFFLPSVSEL